MKENHFETQEYWKNEFLDGNEETFKALDDYLENGTVQKNNEFIFKRMPEILKAAGIPGHDLILTTGIISKAKNVHHLTNKEIKEAVINFSTPIAVFNTDNGKSENKYESIIAITTVEAGNNKPLAFTMNIAVQKKGYEQKYTINEIRSIHDRTLIAKNGVNIVDEWAKAGLLRYTDDKKISSLEKEKEDSFLSPLAKLDAERVFNFTDFVNSRNESKEKNFDTDYETYIHSEEFISKFGDWEKADRLDKLIKSESVKITGTEIAPSDNRQTISRNTKTMPFSMARNFEVNMKIATLEAISF